jgi:hypothetical protein
MICMPAARRLLLSLVMITAAASAGCGFGLDSGPGSHVGGLSCIDDSPQCIDQRKSALTSIINDKERKWVREQPTPAAYASGVRLFAFKHHKRQLTCDELAIGRREADSANAVLRGPEAGNLTPAQVSRGLMLGAEVSRELAAEMQRRCKA